MVCCDYADPFVSDDGLECRSCQQALVPASTGAALDAHEAEYVDDGGDGYLACRCGYGHVLGDDALIDHIHDARLAEQSDV